MLGLKLNHVSKRGHSTYEPILLLNSAMGIITQFNYIFIMKPLWELGIFNLVELIRCGDNGIKLDMINVQKKAPIYIF